MKTWTNPIVEELEVKMTADGENLWYIEKLPGMPDYDLVTNKVKNPS